MEYSTHGTTLGRLGNSHPSIAPFDTYQAADEPFVICAAGQEVYARLCKAIERPDLVDDPRFAINRDRHQHQHILRTEIETKLRAHSAAHWVELLSAAGVPCARIQTIPEAIEMPQLAARNMVISAGGLRMPGNPLKISGFDDPAVRPAAPSLDANGKSIRAEFTDPEPDHRA
jgi:CoA:oxalate CoA-transferase